MVDLKKVIIAITLLIISLFVMTGCHKKDEKITIAEVTHSVFYAPQYIALSEGIFQKYGLDVEIILTSGADKVMASLLSGDAEIGLMGPEASIYVYLEGRSDYAITFAQLTQKDGAFIVGREKIDDFTLETLKGHSILGGRKGGMPEMTLEYILKEHGLKPEQDNSEAEINVRTDVAFAAMAGAFAQGEGDFTTLFEPTASELEKEGKGFVLSSVGEWTENVAYTCYSTLGSYINQNEEVIVNFTKAIKEAQEWVYNHSDNEVAKSLSKYFEGTDLEILTSSIKRYREIDAWSHNPYLDEDEFIHLQKIMMAANELKEFAPYDKLIKNYS